ncbi:MAG: pyridoxamine 5'-phosphate oxidase family protein [Gemmatimonadota bacterium]
MTEGMGHAVDPRTKLRRKDREMDDAWIRAFLAVAPWGQLATADVDGQPFLNANLFVFEPGRRCIYLHTARTGRTRENVEANPRVSFSVQTMGRLLPALEALEFSVEYAGVVCFGRIGVVGDGREAQAALRLLLEKYAPHLEYGADYRAITPEEMDRTAVYRLDIEAWSGKRKIAAEDFPGAYELPEPDGVWRTG